LINPNRHNSHRTRTIMSGDTGQPGARMHRQDIW
jgi:hypothetical protein